MEGCLDSINKNGAAKATESMILTTKEFCESQILRSRDVPFSVSRRSGKFGIPRRRLVICGDMRLMICFDGP